jgi:hypothetical protein
VPFLFAAFCRVGELPAVRPVLNAVGGYRRPFPTFADVAAAIAGNEGGGHSNHAYIGQTVRDAKRARPSDYPAPLYIQGLLKAPPLPKHAHFWPVPAGLALFRLISAEAQAAEAD